MRLDYTQPYHKVKSRLQWLQYRHYKNESGVNKDAFNDLREFLAHLEAKLDVAFFDREHARLLAKRSKDIMVERLVDMKARVKPDEEGRDFDYTTDLNGRLYTIHY